MNAHARAAVAIFLPARRLQSRPLIDDGILRAFRPPTPMQKLLADHQEIRERIADIHDRRLS